MSKVKQRPREIMRLLYTRRDSLLYGCIQFFRRVPNQPDLQFVRQSAPFVMSQSTGHGENVYGSLEELVLEIRQAIDGLMECNNRFRGKLRDGGANLQESRDSSGRTIVEIQAGAEEDRLFFEYGREVRSILLLISLQTRNLFDIVSKFNKESIGLLDYDGNKVGAIRLKELFDYFVHNRYLFVDGEYVSDLFSGRFSPKSSLSNRFMGYKINWREYVDVIRQVTENVKMNQLTGVLRGRLKRLSSSSAHGDTVLLIQNMHLFSKMLTKKIGSTQYSFMLDLLFSEKANQTLADLGYKGGNVEQVVEFSEPHVAICGELDEKKFTIRVRCKIALYGGDGRLLTESTDDHSVDVGYEHLLDLVDDNFGNDLLLTFA